MILNENQIKQTKATPEKWEKIYMMTKNKRVQSISL